jgi:hypothetical protein
MILTAESVREWFAYDAETGIVTRRMRRGKNCAGSVVTGTASHGYLRVVLNGRNYALHRVIFLMVTGEWPTADVDHIDGDRQNNRWSNLRDVSRRVNMENLRSARRNNKSTGLLGVAPHGSMFRSRIRAHGRVIELGVFASAADAHFAYVAAKRIYHEGNTL